jgi:plasmid stability protein
MASLSVRKLDDIVYEQLRVRAARHGIPMEEEVRQILSQAVKTPEQISEVFRKHFGAENGIDLELINPRKPHEPMDFNE